MKVKDIPKPIRPPQTDEERENERWIRSLRDPEHGRDPWYVLVAMGVLGVAFTAWVYFDITAAEAAGRPVALPHIPQAIYNVFGKWGLVGSTAAISLFMIGVGMYGGVFPERGPDQPPPPE